MSNNFYRRPPRPDELYHAFYCTPSRPDDILEHGAIGDAFKRMANRVHKYLKKIKTSKGWRYLYSLPKKAGKVASKAGKALYNAAGGKYEKAGKSEFDNMKSDYNRSASHQRFADSRGGQGHNKDWYDQSVKAMYRNSSAGEHYDNAVHYAKKYNKSLAAKITGKRISDPWVTYNTHGGVYQTSDYSAKRRKRKK